MNYTPKVRQKKSNFWGVFIMKLTYDDKVQIYELRKQEGEYLRAENAILKKLRELRLKEEKEKEERQKLFKN
ncbi:degenerate transposase (orf1) [Streptococcus pneumoniae]|nr:degenerate transposase (orf1) [Streptococcus pneumoniae]